MQHPENKQTAELSVNNVPLPQSGHGQKQVELMVLNSEL